MWCVIQWRVLGLNVRCGVSFGVFLGLNVRCGVSFGGVYWALMFGVVCHLVRCFGP